VNGRGHRKKNLQRARAKARFTRKNGQGRKILESNKDPRKQERQNEIGVCQTKKIEGTRWPKGTQIPKEVVKKTVLWQKKRRGRTRTRKLGGEICKKKRGGCHQDNGVKKRRTADHRGVLGFL